MSADLTERVIHVEPTIDDKQYAKAIGPEKPDMDPEQYERPIGPERPTPTNSNVAEQDAQQRKQEKFEREQEAWNLKQRLKAKDDEYQEEQKEIVRQRQMKPVSLKESAKEFGKGVFGTVKKKTIDPMLAGREKNIAKQEKGLTKEDVQRMIRSQKQPMSKGQFHAPAARRTGFIDPFPKGGGKGGGFPAVDPMGGMGGSGRNMLDFSFGATAKQRQGAHQNQMPPRPAPKPMQFPDPFAGLKKGSGKGKLDIVPGVGKGLGMGYGAKTGKKLKRMDDWMNF